MGGCPGMGRAFLPGANRHGLTGSRIVSKRTRIVAKLRTRLAHCSRVARVTPGFGDDAAGEDRMSPVYIRMALAVAARDRGPGWRVPMTRPGGWRSRPRPGQDRASRAHLSVAEARRGTKRACSKTLLPSSRIFVPRLRTFVSSSRTFVPSSRTFVPSSRTFVSSSRTFVPSSTTFVSSSKTLLTLARAVGFCSAQDCDRQASDHTRAESHPSEERTIRATSLANAPTLRSNA